MNNRTTHIVIAGFLLAVAALLSPGLWQDQDGGGKKRGERSAPMANLNAEPDGAQAPAALVSEAAAPVFVGAPKAAPPAETVKALVQTPVVFYGVVLDQDQKPINDAVVQSSVVDNASRPTSFPVATTGPDGRFALHSQGVSLHVAVSKDGHSLVGRGEALRRSNQGFDYGTDTGRGVHRPDPAAPVIFHLRKAGNPVALEALNGQTIVPRDGSPVVLDLNATKSSQLTIRCTTHEDEGNPAAPFSWRCEIEALGGSIQEAKDTHNFVAPEAGYVPMAVIDMPKTLPPQGMEQVRDQAVLAAVWRRHFWQNRVSHGGARGSLCRGQRLAQPRSP